MRSGGTKVGDIAARRAEGKQLLDELKSLLDQKFPGELRRFEAFESGRIVNVDVDRTYTYREDKNFGPIFMFAAVAGDTPLRRAMKDLTNIKGVLPAEYKKEGLVPSFRVESARWSSGSVTDEALDEFLAVLKEKVGKLRTELKGSIAALPEIAVAAAAQGGAGDSVASVSTAPFVRALALARESGVDNFSRVLEAKIQELTHFNNVSEAQYTETIESLVDLVIFHNIVLQALAGRDVNLKTLETALIDPVVRMHVKGYIIQVVVLRKNVEGEKSSFEVEAGAIVPRSSASSVHAFEGTSKSDRNVNERERYRRQRVRGSLESRLEQSDQPGSEIRDEWINTANLYEDSGATEETKAVKIHSPVTAEMNAVTIVDHDKKYHCHVLLIPGESFIPAFRVLDGLAKRAYPIIERNPSRYHYPDAAAVKREGAIVALLMQDILTADPQLFIKAHELQFTFKRLRGTFEGHVFVLPTSAQLDALAAKSLALTPAAPHTSGHEKVYPGMRPASIQILQGLFDDLPKLIESEKQKEKDKEEKRKEKEREKQRERERLNRVYGARPSQTAAELPQRERIPDEVETQVPMLAARWLKIKALCGKGSLDSEPLSALGRNEALRKKLGVVGASELEEEFKVIKCLTTIRYWRRLLKEYQPQNAENIKAIAGLEGYVESLPPLVWAEILFGAIAPRFEKIERLLAQAENKQIETKSAVPSPLLAPSRSGAAPAASPPHPLHVDSLSFEDLQLRWAIQASLASPVPAPLPVIAAGAGSPSQLLPHWPEIKAALSDAGADRIQIASLLRRPIDALRNAELQSKFGDARQLDERLRILHYLLVGSGHASYEPRGKKKLEEFMNTKQTLATDEFNSKLAKQIDLQIRTIDGLLEQVRVPAPDVDQTERARPACRT